MNPVTDIVFSLTWVLLFIWAIRSISKGWNTNLNSPTGMWTTKVTKPMHPEMIDDKPGEELMGVTFEKRNSCDIKDYNELQTRINDLREQLEDDDDDENFIGLKR